MSDSYWIVGGDGKEYGPVPLATLAEWIRDRRAISSTRVRKGSGPLMEASAYPELAGFFSGGAAAAVYSPAGSAAVPSELRVWELIGRAWNLVKPHWLPIGAMFFIDAAIASVPLLGCLVQFFIGGAIMVGIWRAILGMLDGRKPTVGMMFDGFDRFADAFLCFLVSTILIGLGLLCLVVPGVILGLMWIFAFPILGETKIGFWEAMRASSALTEGNRWRLFLLCLAWVPIVILAILLVHMIWLPRLLTRVIAHGVILFAIAPVFFTALALAYRVLQQRRRQPA